MLLRRRFRLSVFGKSLSVLNKRDKQYLLIVLLIQIFLGILDLLGVALVGVLGALAISGVENGKTGNRVNAVLNLFNLEGLNFQRQAAVIGLFAAALLIGRTLLSVYFTRRILFFLSRRGAQISANLVSKLLSQNLIELKQKTSQETLYALTEGVSSVTIGVIGITISILSDASLFVIMSVGLFVVDPLIAAGTLLLFTLIGIALYRNMHEKARILGIRNSELAIEGNERIYEVISSYREAIVRGRREYYAEQIGKIRSEAADVLAEINFMPNISKYVIESSVTFGALLIGAIQFIRQDAIHAVATLSIFLAAGSRIAPALLRVQQGAVSIKSFSGSAKPTLNLIDQLSKFPLKMGKALELSTEHIGFVGSIEMSDCKFTYPDASAPAVVLEKLTINPGELIAIVGPSGAGKSTLADLLLGILPPDSGSIRISGKTPKEAIETWPGAIAYVPQEALIVNGSIRHNVSLGYPETHTTDLLVGEALQKANLFDFINTLDEKLDWEVGERGGRISGGQRQRLGVARALFTKPQLLVLDEATSALDAETENRIANSIQALRGEVTIITIAHRLSTVRNANLVIYMDQGKILAQGTFEEVRSLIPNFDIQAKLMGL